MPFNSDTEVTNPQLIVVVGAAGLLSNIVGLFLFHGEFERRTEGSEEGRANLARAAASQIMEDTRMEEEEGTLTGEEEDALDTVTAISSREPRSRKLRKPPPPTPRLLLPPTAPPFSLPTPLPLLPLPPLPPRPTMRTTRSPRRSSTFTPELCARILSSMLTSRDTALTRTRLRRVEITRMEMERLDMVTPMAMRMRRRRRSLPLVGMEG